MPYSITHEQFPKHIARPQAPPRFISQSWRKIDFSPRLRDKIWVGPGDEAHIRNEWVVSCTDYFLHKISLVYFVFVPSARLIIGGAPTRLLQRRVLRPMTLRPGGGCAMQESKPRSKPENGPAKKSRLL